MVKLLRDPEFGFGKNVNPCMDCKAMMYGLAARYMERRGADFIATGEVIGQRPMSQRREAFRKMEQAAGVQDIVLRPLCARHLPPTKPEREGLVDRQELLDLAGRSRKPQMKLAEQWGVEDYPAPAGGCRLTDPNYAERIEALMNMERLTVANALLVQNGRFFPLDEGAFAVVGREHEDNLNILRTAPADAALYDLRDLPGPLAALVGPATDASVAEVKRLVIRYSRFEDVKPDRVCTKTPPELRRQWRGVEAG
jgi:tRNA U34 2-thiouridine synthase MnmA/TrmU